MGIFEVTIKREFRKKDCLGGKKGVEGVAKCSLTRPHEQIGKKVARKRASREEWQKESSILKKRTDRSRDWASFQVKIPWPKRMQFLLGNQGGQKKGVAGVRQTKHCEEDIPSTPISLRKGRLEPRGVPGWDCK